MGKLYNGQEIPEGMSRKAFKKQCKLAKMEADRDEFIAKRKQKRKEIRQKKSKDPNRNSKPKIFPTQIDTQVKCVIDCSFDDLMTEGEVTSLAGQISRCYSTNRRSPTPADLEITAFNKRLKQKFEIDMHNDFRSWQNITFSEDYNYNEPNLVYLTGDADETLNTLDPNHTYVIGGIVDKDRHKNLCLNKAQKLNIRTAKLPISEHIKISGRKILTTNHVFELLIKYLELKDWTAAFEAVLPTRKLAVEN